MDSFGFNMTLSRAFALLISIVVLLSTQLKTASADSADYRPTAEDIRRYFALIEQQRQAQERNNPQRNTINNYNNQGSRLQNSIQDNQNSDIPEGYESSYEQVLAKERPQDSNPSSDRFSWYQGQVGQPEVVSNDEVAIEAIEYPDSGLVYSPKEDQQELKSITTGTENRKFPTSNAPSEQKKSEQISANDDAPFTLQRKDFSTDSKPNPLSDIYFVVIVAGCSAVAIFGVIAAGYCFYRFQKNSKAAAEVDYPAYGVTGPNKEHSTSPSGDRRLAQSAQMYHYQHQKQQMIAVEKATAVRNTSASDVDSEEENEEGDYTVYECPGLAPTGEMEVKNPLFHDDSTPMSPPVTAKETVKN